ncbi:MAG: hypothetical protein VXA07_09245 [Halieaceae bacterium]
MARLTCITWAAALAMLTGVKLVNAQEAAVTESAPASVEATDQLPDAEISEAPPPQADPTGSVLDYEPSESISEDLSVSFPVDI